MSATPQVQKVVCHFDQQFMGREQPTVGGDQFDRQRQAIDAHADRGQRHGILLAQFELRRVGAQTRQQQRNRLDLRQRMQRRQRSQIGQLKRRQFKGCFNS